MSALLVELRLPRFKSLRDATIPLGDLTLLVGRNGSGKSNVLDALTVLSALATGRDLRDALDGGRDGPVVRGGSAGCAPAGEDSFALGCSADIDGTRYHLDLEVEVEPRVQIRSERFWTLRTSGPKRGEARELLRSDAPNKDSADLVARWDNQKRGYNPPVVFRATQLLLTQVSARVPTAAKAGREIHEIAEQFLSVLTGIFVLDPVPHQMREYVPEKDQTLRRGADNLSAVLAGLLKDPQTGNELLDMTRALSEAEVSDLSTVTSELGDVMVTLQERIGGRERPIPARLMSDGTLRFLAMAAGLLGSPFEGVGPRTDSGARLLVVEELENGLHPSQAALLLSQLKNSATRRGVRTFATTHSPALLDALEGEDHHSVVVCSRGSDGWSIATPLTDFPDYARVVSRGSLGRAATEDQLRPGDAPSPITRDSLTHLLGLGGNKSA